MPGVTSGKQILHSTGGFILDRIQSAGPGDPSLNEEKIYELGNFQSVGTVTGSASVSFNVESLDVTTEMEALLTGNDPSATIAGDEFDFNDHIPINLISPFKESGTSYNIGAGILIPFLTLESASYSFGVEANATQTFTLAGDTMQWVNGAPYEETFTVTAGTNQVYTLAETALLYEDGGDDYYVTSVIASNATTKAYKRLTLGDDYTNTAANFTTLDDLDGEGYTQLKVIYGTAATQAYPQTVHQDTTVKPAAVRGRDIDIYLGDTAATPTFTRWRSVQSVDINWSVTLEEDRELGNAYAFARDYEIPEVAGSVTMKSRDVAELIAKIQEVTGVTNDVIGPFEKATLPMEIRISHPDTGVRLKTFYIPDAQFTVPGSTGQVQAKHEVTIPYTSDGGQLLVYAGER